MPDLENSIIQNSWQSKVKIEKQELQNEYFSQMKIIYENIAIHIKDTSLTLHHRIPSRETFMNVQNVGRSLIMAQIESNVRKIHTCEKPFASKVCGKAFTICEQPA